MEENPLFFKPFAGYFGPGFIFLKKRRKMSEGAVGRDLSCKLRRPEWEGAGNGRVYKNPASSTAETI